MLSHLHEELSDAEYVVFVNSSRQYVDVSDGVCKLLGYSRKELLNKKIEDVSYARDDVPEVFAEYVRKGSMQGEYVLQRKDRTPLPILYKAFVFQDGCHAAIWTPLNDWRTPYLEALLEINPAKLQTKVGVALAAIERFQESHPDQGEKERQAIRDALLALRTLSRQ